MSNDRKSIEERIAILELKEQLKSEELRQINEKLDQLVALRYKGVGAFWLASALLGTGIIGGLATFMSWLKGGF